MPWFGSVHGFGATAQFGSVRFGSVCCGGRVRGMALAMLRTQQYRFTFNIIIKIMSHPWGVFQKAGYVTYLGMFEYERADNLSFRFQNRRLLSGYVSNHSNLLSEDNLLRSSFCFRVSSLQSHQPAHA